MPTNDDRFERTIDELEQVGCKWWPKEIRERADQMSILQVLLDTQEQFISIIKLANKQNYSSLFQLIEASPLSYKLFVKHLMILTDVGAEPLQRVNSNLGEVFPTGKMEIDCDGRTIEYDFLKLPINGLLNNKRLKLDSKEALQMADHDIALCKDVIMILCFGASSINERTRAVLYKCILSDFFGKADQIDTFVRQNYVRVSKIISGKAANDLGNVAQVYVRDFLAEKLGTDYDVRISGTIPGVTENDGVSLISFDIVAHRQSDTSRHKKYVAIEVSFQETTNSVIERKSGQARPRFEKVTASRNYIAYVLDGAGNFTRRSASSVLCQNSHCTVGLTNSELELLVEFIKEKIG